MGVCQCLTGFYFDSASYSCLSQTLINTTCSANFTCRTDLGLNCDNGICHCIASKKFWSSLGCTGVLTYGQTGCTMDSECQSSLICNLNVALNNCNCPIMSKTGMCDCPRIDGNEKYWDSNVEMCVPAVVFGMVCSIDYMCQTITQGATCSSYGNCYCGINGVLSTNNKCKTCGSLKYYNAKCYGSIACSGITTSSRNTCCSVMNMNAQIAQLKDLATVNFVASNFDKQFVGADSLSGSFKWFDGTSINPSFWCLNEPKNMECVLSNGFCLSAALCNSTDPVVCEYIL